MANYCGQMKGCPAGQYSICPAYDKDRNCWEVANLPCCRRNDKKRCSQCTLYAAFIHGDYSQVYPETIKATA